MPPRSRREDSQPVEQVREAGARRAAALDEVKPGDRGMVDALLIERRGYQQRGLPERVAEVDEQLALRGYRAAD